MLQRAERHLNPVIYPARISRTTMLNTAEAGPGGAETPLNAPGVFHMKANIHGQIIQYANSPPPDLPYDVAPPDLLPLPSNIAPKAEQGNRTFVLDHRQNNLIVSNHTSFVPFSRPPSFEAQVTTWTIHNVLHLATRRT